MAIRRFIAGLLILLGLTSSALAGPRFVVYSDNTAMSRQLQQLLAADLRQHGAVEVVEPDPSAAAPTAGSAGDIAVAIGAPMLRQLALGAARQVIVVLITRSALEDELARLPGRSGRDIHAIVLDQPVGRYLDLVRLALPQRQRVGVLLGRGGPPPQMSLEKSAQERGLALSSQRMLDDAGFIPQLERLLTQADVLLALPDPLVHNRNTVQPLLLTTYRAGVPVVAYSEAYANAGALMALYSTPAQLVRQAGEVARSLSLGKSVPQIQAPRYFSVAVNASVARSLGLTLPSGEALRDRLMQLQSAAE